ncbi:hypothetical protein [Micromonospora profundi]|uniref:hypothetical protein n=1 Tax=Micromonospora profundi TaxID=1420889 RepID=UPI0038297CC1
MLHPWPEPLPASWSGQLKQPEPLRYMQVEPNVVVEIVAVRQRRQWATAHAVATTTELAPQAVSAMYAALKILAGGSVRQGEHLRTCSGVAHCSQSR